MARIVLTTFGSSGDINPYVALALGLRARGHDVTFAVEESFRDLIERLGFPVAHLAGDAIAVMNAQSLDLLRDTNPFRSVYTLIRDYIVPTARPRIEDLRVACAGADLLVASPFQVAASFIHDLTGIPLVTLTLTPVTIPSAQVNPAPQQLGLPKALDPMVNRITWGVGLALMSAFFDPPINRIRAEYHLPPLRHWMYTGKDHWSPRTALAVSRAFFTPPPDLPETVSVTGFLYWDTPTDWQEPPELTAFFAGDRPVVAVSSGSMSAELGPIFADFYQTSITALQQVGARALILGAAPGALPDPLPENTLAAALCALLRNLPTLRRHHSSRRRRHNGAGAARGNARVDRAVGRGPVLRWRAGRGHWRGSLAPAQTLYRRARDPPARRVAPSGDGIVRERDKSPGRSPRKTASARSATCWRMRWSASGRTARSS